MQQFTQILLESSLSTLHHISLSELCVPITSHSPPSSRNARFGLCHSPLFTPVLLHLLIGIDGCPKAMMTCFHVMCWVEGCGAGLGNHLSSVLLLEGAVCDFYYHYITVINSCLLSILAWSFSAPFMLRRQEFIIQSINVSSIVKLLL